MQVDQNTRLLLSGQFGEQAKFICQYMKCDLVSLESIITTDYDACFTAFVQSLHELLTSLKRGSLAATAATASVSPELIVEEIVAVEKKDEVEHEHVEKNSKKLPNKINKKMDK
jgi:hypothetical protein